QNVKGVLGIIATALSEENVNIESGSVRSLMENKSEVDFVVEVKDAAHLYHVIDKLRSLESVEEVSRTHVGEK
ncbi:ACT domain-containing protein, partial [Desulfovibrio sp. OttesenSCG-928-O18]|nr:ACT domain-containing protein [Desulfovibrio sp. OttesenSCG-928-O18]